MIITAPDPTLPPPPISETDDLPNDLGTTQTLQFGQTFTGAIDPVGEDQGDWLRLDLEAGTQYVLTMDGITLGDPWINLLDASGFAIRSNDDGGPGLNSRLVFTVTETGTYYVQATFYGQSRGRTDAGSYTLSLSGNGSGFLLEGSGLDDQITGSAHADTLIGYGGDDLINGNGGSDSVEAGGGNDTISNVGSGGTVSAGSGDDVIEASVLGRVFSGEGDDFITTGGVRQRIFGGHGRDTVIGTEDARDLVIWLGNGDDRVDLTNGQAWQVSGGGGDDVILFTGRTVHGEDGNDTIREVGGGGQVHSGISGGEGDDFLVAFTPGRRVFGDEGNDTLKATGAWAQLYGGEGNDVLIGAAGGDTIIGGRGDDSLTGNRGDDWLSGEAGADQISGGLGHDTLAGGAQGDALSGDSGNDRLFGDAGFDTLSGGSGHDTLFGGVGRDSLDGDAGNDVLRGGVWHDTLNGGIGDDTLIGDEGRDTFVFSEGSDMIMDFEARDAHDLIDFAPASGIADFADLVANHATEEADGLRIEDDAGSVMFLRGITIADLEAASFLF